MADFRRVVLGFLLRLILLLISDLKCLLPVAECVVRMVPKHTVARVGDAATFNCTSNLTGSQISPVLFLRNIAASKPDETIYVNGTVNMPFRSRFSVDNPVAGQYLMSVYDVIMKDAGTYTCMDYNGNGRDSHAELTVLDDSMTKSLSHGEVLCCTFEYRGTATLTGRWVAVLSNKTQSLHPSTTEKRLLSNFPNQKVELCFNATKLQNADIQFEIYSEDFVWKSARYTFRQHATSTMPVKFNELLAEGVPKIHDWHNVMWAIIASGVTCFSAAIVFKCLYIAWTRRLRAQIKSAGFEIELSSICVNRSNVAYLYNNLVRHTDTTCFLNKDTRKNLSAAGQQRMHECAVSETAALLWEKASSMMLHDHSSRSMEYVELVGDGVV